LRKLSQIKVWARRNRNYELIVSRVPGQIRAHHSAMAPGPLSPRAASSFVGGRYAAVELSEDIQLFRVWDPDGNAGELGGYWSLDPHCGLQARIDLALPPSFRNQATRMTAVRVPAGHLVYVGEAGSQGGAFVGGGAQVLVGGGVSPDWVVEVVLRRRDFSYRNLNSDF
jgi:hypothetical protein